jgi:hypothetical protein
VDIYRYLLGFSDAETSWRKIQDTAIWRKAKKIDSILSEDLRSLYRTHSIENTFYLSILSEDLRSLLDTIEGLFRTL